MRKGVEVAINSLHLFNPEPLLYLQATQIWISYCCLTAITFNFLQFIFSAKTFLVRIQIQKEQFFLSIRRLRLLK